MIAEVATNLLGEIVEVYQWSHGYSGEPGDYRLRGRGYVRAVYVADKALMVLVEHSLGYDSMAYSDRAKDGGFETYPLHEHRVRVVQRCARCYSWDLKKIMFLQAGAPPNDLWEHKDNEGCKKVGHNG